MSSRFDQLDLQILEALQQDGRRAFAAIARDLGVSEGTIRARIRRLQRLRIVKFIAEVNPLEMGLTLAFAGIRVKGVPLRHAAAAVAEIPEVNYVTICLGSFDLLVELVCADNVDLLDVLGQLHVTKGVDLVETFTTLEVTKDTYTYRAWAGLFEKSPVRGTRT